MNGRTKAGLMLLLASQWLWIHMLFQSVLKKLGLPAGHLWEQTALESLWVRGFLLSLPVMFSVVLWGAGCYLLYDGIVRQKAREAMRSSQILKDIRNGQPGDHPHSVEAWRHTHNLQRKMAEAQAQAAYQKQASENAAHQLRSALFSCQLNCDFLEEASDAEELKDLKEGLQRCARICEEFLQVSVADSRLQPFHFQKTNLKNLIIEYLQHSDASLIEVTGQVVPFYMDPVWMQEALITLIENAKEHAPEGSVINVDIQEKQGMCTVKIRNRSEQKLDPSCMERYRTAGNGHYGIGLDLAREVVQAHHGNLEISCLNGMVTFTMLLPLLAMEQEKA